MHHFLDTFLTRVQATIKESGSISALLNRPWVGTGVGGRSMFLFRSNGELLISQRGDVETARWEHIPGLHALMLDFDGEKSIYTYGFCGDAVLVLRQDGTDTNLLLGDESILGSVSEETLARYLDAGRVQALPEREKSKTRLSVAPRAVQGPRPPKGWLSVTAGVMIGVVCLIVFALLSYPDDISSIVPSALIPTFPSSPPEAVGPPDHWYPTVEPLHPSDGNPFLDPSFRDNAAPASFYTPQPVP